MPIAVTLKRRPPGGYFSSTGFWLRELDMYQLVGILTFPSFHGTAAMLYTWAFCPVRWLRPLNLLCNGSMMVATPVGGGHYFVDVIAGIALAAASIHATHRICLALATARQRDAAMLLPEPTASVLWIRFRHRRRYPS